MTEERVLREATFTPEAIRYHSLSATIGSAFLFVILGLALAFPTVGISLILLAVPAGVWALSKWYYTKYFAKLSCVLTDRKLKISKGLIFRTEKAVPLDKITDVQKTQGPLMRYLDLESMSVETAGGTGATGGALVSLVGIEDSRAFREEVLEQRDRVVGTHDAGESARPAPSGTAAAPAPAADAESLAVLSEIRDTLARIETRLHNEPDSQSQAPD